MANSATTTIKARDISAKVETKGSTTITAVETDRIRDRVETVMAAMSLRHNSSLKPNRFPPVWPLHNNKCHSRCRLSKLILKPLCYNSNR